MLKNNYLKILEAFNSSSLKEIEKKSGYRHWFIIGFIIFFIASIIVIIMSNEYTNFYISGLGVFLGLYIFIGSKQIIKEFIKIYVLTDESFLKQNQMYWRGVRALIFFEKIEQEKIEFKSEEIISTINKELELKKFDILKMPFFVGIFAIVGMIFSSIFALSMLLLNQSANRRIAISLSTCSVSPSNTCAISKRWCMT